MSKPEISKPEISKPEITVQERAEFWRKRHDLLLAQYGAEKARVDFDKVARTLNERAEGSGYRLAHGEDGEPCYLPAPSEAPRPVPVKKES